MGRHAFTDWKCDQCFILETMDDGCRPENWHRVTVTMDDDKLRTAQMERWICPTCYPIAQEAVGMDSFESMKPGGFLAWIMKVFRVKK